MTTPYIGSKISLISKSGIRYEGILYTVDPEKATIALAKVRSFGTEDRPTAHPVPVRSEVYEYIIFKAGDIEDLMVCETPQPAAPLGGGLPYDDPAIVLVSKQPNAVAPGTASHQGAGAFGGLVSDTSVHLSSSKGPVSAGSGTTSRSETPLHRVLSPPGATGPQNRAPGAGRQAAAAAGGGGAWGSNRSGPVYQQQNTRGGHGGYGDNWGRGAAGVTYRGRGGMRGSAGGGGGGGGRGGHMFRGGYRPQHQQDFGRRGGFQPRGGRGGGFNRADAHERRPKFDGDYDFEKANKQFKETLDNLKDEMHKTKITDDKEHEKDESKEQEEGEVESVDEEEEEEEEEGKAQFYDKTKSFFDNISCEALERTEGNGNRNNVRRRERDLNQETFGQSALRNFGYRRGGGRGGGGGGGYRRGGMGYQGGYNRYR